MAKIHEMLSFGYALRKSFGKGYNFQTFKCDAIAGLVVSLVALPLAMAFSIAVGLPPQHGLYTSIVAGMIVPLLGGAATQVTGATAAFIMIVSAILHTHGLHGLMLAEMMAGVLLIIMGMAKLGKYVSYVPYPVTVGFTSGIAVMIAALAINDFLGLPIPANSGGLLSRLALTASHIQEMQWQAMLIGCITLIAIVYSGRIITIIPSPVIGIGCGILGNAVLSMKGFSAETVRDCFSYPLANGGTGHGIAAILPTLHIPTAEISALFTRAGYHSMEVLFVPALIIAGLCALQTLLSATVADSLAGTKHNSNAELIAIGTGNILAGMTAGLPASGAIARTETNIHSGAKTPLAAIIHALLIMLYVLLLAPYLSYIPMASLAALLITVAYRMSHWQQCFRIIQIAPRSDTLVLLACFGFTAFVDMVAGVTVGILLACFLLVKRIADLMQSTVSHASTSSHTKIKHLTLPDDVMVYHLHGMLFFGTVEKAFDRTDLINDHINTLIIDMEDVPLIDMTGLVAIKAMILSAQSNGRTVLLCGPPEVTHKILQKLPMHVRHGFKTFGSLVDAITFTMNRNIHDLTRRITD